MKKSWATLRQHWRYVLIISLVVLLNAWILERARAMYPVKQGTAAEFWYALYHHETYKRCFGDSVYPVQGNTCIYYIMGIHRELLYTVPLSDVNEAYAQYREAVLAKPELLTPPERDLLCGNAKVSDLVDAHLAVEKEWIQANLAARGIPGANTYWDDRQKDFKARWQRASNYWINVAFEICFLSLLLCALIAPFLRKNAHRWRAITAGLFLPVLCLPLFLGYCTMTNTSIGPSGGAAYPWILIWLRPFRCDWNRIDIAITNWLGYPLANLSQDGGPWMAVTGMGSISPTATLIYGVILGGLVFLASWGFARWRNGPLKTPKKIPPEPEDIDVPPDWDEHRPSANRPPVGSNPNR